jgi:hypothetical protein
VAVYLDSSAIVKLAVRELALAGAGHRNGARAVENVAVNLIRRQLSTVGFV